MTDFAAEPLARALRRLPPRDAQWLRLRYLEGLSAQELARAYGVRKDTVPVHTLRAARLFARAVEEGATASEAPLVPLTPLDAPPLSDAEESHLAARLEADAEPTLGPPLRALKALSEEIRRLEAEWEAQAQNSPRRRREDWLRRAALLALIAVALWLYLRGE